MYIKYIDINKSKLYNEIINYSLNLELDEIIISIDKAERGYEGKILISKKLDDKALTKLSIKRDVKIKIDEQHKKYLRYHRNNKFKN